MKSIRIKPDSPAVLALAIPVIAALALGAKEIWDWGMAKMKKPATKISGEEYKFQDEGDGQG